MKAERQKLYNLEQKAAIELYKWLESEKAGHDLGNEAVMTWMLKFPRKFRKGFLVKDLKEAICNLKEIENTPHNVDFIERASVKLLLVAERIQEALELIETEKDELTEL